MSAQSVILHFGALSKVFPSVARLLFTILIICVFAGLKLYFAAFTDVTGAAGAVCFVLPAKDFPTGTALTNFGSGFPSGFKSVMTDLLLIFLCYF